jgi:hypothetical protein
MWSGFLSARWISVNTGLAVLVLLRQAGLLRGESPRDGETSAAQGAYRLQMPRTEDAAAESDSSSGITAPRTARCTQHTENGAALQ